LLAFYNDIFQINLGQCQFADEVGGAWRVAKTRGLDLQMVHYREL